MTSMKFDKVTVSKIQSLIDEKKTELSEGDYIRMCNATKVVHDLAPTQETIPIRMVRNVFLRNGPEVPAYKNLQFTPSPDNIEIIKLEERKDKLIKEIKELKRSKRNRIINDDKYIALIDFCSKNNVNYQFHSKCNTMTKKIVVLEDRIRNTVLLDFNRIYRAQMNARVSYTKMKNIEFIQSCEGEIKQITMKLRELRND